MRRVRLSGGDREDAGAVLRRGATPASSSRAIARSTSWPRTRRTCPPRSPTARRASPPRIRSSGAWRVWPGTISAGR